MSQFTIVFGFESPRRGQGVASSGSRGLVHRERFDLEALATFAFDTWEKNPPSQCDWLALVREPSKYDAKDAALLRTFVFKKRDDKRVDDEPAATETP